MRINIDREVAIKLLTAVKQGYLETSEIAELQRELDARQPARILSTEEIKKLLDELENEY